MPALGRPTRPASAISFSRSQIQRSSPGWPGLALRGARLVEDLKCALPKPPLPPCGQHEFFAERGQVGEQGFVVLVEDLRADRNLEHDGLAIGAMAVLAHAVDAPLGLEVLLVAIVDQRVQPVDRLDHDIAAAAAIAAVGPAELNELFAAKRHAAVAAVAGADIDLGFVKEFHGF